MTRPRLINFAVIIRVLTMSIVWLVLLSWFLNAYRSGCGTALLVFAVISLFLLMAGFEAAFLRRRALYNEFVSDDDHVFDLFHNLILTGLRELIFGLILAMFLLIGVLVFEPRQWSLLFADLLVMTLLIPRFALSMSNRVREPYRFAMARQSAMWLSILLLWSEALMVLTLSPREHYIGMRWQEVVTYGVAQPDLSCPIVAQLANIFVVGQALAMWAVQNATRVMNDPTQAIMVWVGFFILFSFTFMVARAFSQALIGVMGRPWELWSSPTKNAAYDAAATPSTKRTKRTRRNWNQPV
ncbi:MAG TPA: hypothetical protein DDY14_03525 [Chromatiaceae bacterium]|jgi:hypothetical protein|nr:MAG: hypothetical protein N838_25340 [Thiohalocapsa sp. PB-PSB1]QQO54818.1 MAG: hypothetical protein N838_17190 [Thiohalocapsa sp. PB-PSB1]HBG94397.1 hypothetical protein [Chromatiaceae bacterium]HCS91074.1 hypothetical protein [Chromatiaceae bacterium]